jgi:signal transduction histidine kinase
MVSTVASKILVADDAPDSVQLLEDLLTAEGYQVITASDGAQALDRALKERPSLVLLDVMMPKMDGFEVCRQLKQVEGIRFTPVVLITILQDLEYKIKGLEAGADEFLSKPFNRLELLTRVRALLRTNHLHLELQYSYEELRRLEGFRDDLVAMIVHDLRSPLTVILGTLEVLQEDLRDVLNEEQAHAVSVAISSARRQMNLIHNMLDVQRLEEHKMPLNLSYADLGQVIRSAASGAGLQARWREVELAIDIPPDLPQVHVDPVLVERVLINLLDNALRHTATGGKVRVSAELLPAAPSEIPFRGQPPGSPAVVVHVADTGSGVPEAYREVIFEKFKKAGSTQAGTRATTGLGLTFCRMAIEAQGGRIWVGTEPGWGAVFSFTLPIDDHSMRQTPDHSPSPIAHEKAES